MNEIARGARNGDLWPLLLTCLRAALAPVLAALAIYRPDPLAFGLCLVAGFVSDVFDGIIARRLGVATAQLRRMDSAADTLFYLAAAFAAWRLYPSAILGRQLPLGLLLALEVARYAFDLVKFRREASYHMWSSKLWGIALFSGFFGLLVFGNAGLPVSLMVWIGIAADVEGLLISVVLRQWQPDVPTIYHALRFRRAASE